jgi:hypothetical protein
MRFILKRLAWLLLWAALLALGAGRARAASGTMVTNSDGRLTLQISTQWVDGGGYRPIQVAVVPVTPPVADQTLHIEFHAQQLYNSGQREIAVSQDIEIPAGSTSVSATIAVPQQFLFQACRAEVWLDGKYSSKLSQQAFAGGGGAPEEGLPNVLVVDGVSITAAGAPLIPIVPILPVVDSSQLAALFPPQQVRQYGVPVATAVAGATGAPLPTLISVPYNGLPRRWIELSSLDLICISMGDLRLLSTDEPERCQALRQWTAAGGNLIVFDTGDKLQATQELDYLLAPTAPKSTLASAEWARPNPSDFGDRLNNGPYGGTIQPVVTGIPLVVPEEPPFLLRPFGSGMVLAAGADDLFKQPPQHWVWMLNSLGADRWLWFRRHGLSLNRQNADFWNWLVRGVGLAPVTQFRVLITVFVLVIGPVNYFWLRRRGRLHLLVVIVPLAACAVTLLLFGYAMVADGLDVRVRARSFTHLNQRTGQAVCWSRLSYYAGLAPSGGLVFPDDVVALPLTANDGDASVMSRRQNIIWSTGKQEFVSGWIASRTPTQFVTVRSRTSPANLLFFAPPGRADWQVENQLGTRVVRLLVADEHGQHYQATDLADGARMALTAVDPAEVEVAIYKIVDACQPEVPEGFVPQSSGFRGMMRWRGNNNGLAAASLNSGLLEAGLRDAVMGPGKHVSWLKPGGFPLEKRSYLAIVERSPEVTFGVDRPREEDSLHVIVGKW